MIRRIKRFSCVLIVITIVFSLMASNAIAISVSLEDMYPNGIPLDETSAIAIGYDTYEYTGMPIKPEIAVVAIVDGTLVKDRDYDVVYENYIGPGKATVYAYGKGKYIGVIKKDYYITIGSSSTPTPKPTSTPRPTSAPKKFNITVNPPVNGKAYIYGNGYYSTSVSAEEGASFGVKAIPDEGYKLKSIYVYGMDITENKYFAVKNYDTYVYVTFKKENEYTIKIAETTGGKVSVSKNEASSGDEITISANPAVGYTLDVIKVNGEAIVGNSFIMPEKNVIVSVVFKKNENIVASGFCGKDISYALDNNGTLYVSGSGNMYNSQEWSSNKHNIKSVVFSGNITSIGDRAFESCVNLTSIKIPDSVTSIGNYAFYYCSSLKSIVLPESITTIGAGAFYVCWNLTKVELNYGLTSIGNGAFTSCTSLKSINIPDSVSNIGSNAFSNCTSLTTIIIPDSVTQINHNAFSSCKKLESISIPLSITQTDVDAFQNCISLTNVYYDGTREQFERIEAIDKYSSNQKVPIYNAFGGNVIFHYNVTPLKIKTQPVDIFGSTGNTANFKIKAQGTGLKYQWQTFKSGTWVNSSLPGATTATLSVDITNSRNGNKYRCLLFDNYNNSLISSVAVLNVISPVSISTQPKDFTGLTGTIATFTVTAKGTGLKYQWQTYKSGKWSNSSLTGSTNSSLSVDITDSRDGYKFRCVITDAGKNTITSNTVTLRVAAPVSITTQPKDFTGVTGSVAKFSIVAKGVGVKYQWQTFKSDTWVNSSFPGATTDTLSVDVTNSRDGYKFRCVVKDTYNKTSISDIVTLHAVAPVYITSQPKDFTGVIGENAIFSVVAQGSGLKYQWQSNSSGTWVNSSLPGATSTTLTVGITSARDGYKFRCVVTDSYNKTTTSNEVILHTVSSVSITTQPKDYVGTVGNTATFNVIAKGTGLKYQWQTNSSGTWVNSSLPGSTTATLSVDITNSRNGYKFRCVVTDNYKKTVTSTAATLNVVSAVSITAQPESFSGPVGSIATFKVAAQGAGLKYQWQTLKSGNWVNSSLPGATTASLSVDVTKSRDGYQFRCVITDNYNNSVSSNSATLYVTPTVSIVLQPEDYTGLVGTTAVFKVEAQGAGLKYQWQVNKSGTWTNSSLPGYNTDTLSVDITSSRQGYKFRCVVTDVNNKKVTSDVAVLYAYTKSSFSITSGPKDYTGPVGSTAKFTVVAQGEGLKYQWYTVIGTENGDVVTESTFAGANTPTLSVPVTSSLNGYRFRCVVSNSTETHVSGTATLYVSNYTSPITIRSPYSLGVIEADDEQIKSVIELPEMSDIVTDEIIETEIIDDSQQLTSEVNVDNSDMKSEKATENDMTMTDELPTIYLDGKDESNVDRISVDRTLMFILQPDSYIGQAGDTVKFSVEAKGEHLSYQWQCFKDGEWVDLTINGSDKSELTIVVTEELNALQYRCIVTDFVGNKVISDVVDIMVID